MRLSRPRDDLRGDLRSRFAGLLTRAPSSLRRNERPDGRTFRGNFCVSSCPSYPRKHSNPRYSPRSWSLRGGNARDLRSPRDKSHRRQIGGRNVTSRRRGSLTPWRSHQRGGGPEQQPAACSFQSLAEASAPPSPRCSGLTSRGSFLRLAKSTSSTPCLFLLPLFFTFLHLSCLLAARRTAVPRARTRQ